MVQISDMCTEHVWALLLLPPLPPPHYKSMVLQTQRWYQNTQWNNLQFTYCHILLLDLLGSYPFTTFLPFSCLFFHDHCTSAPPTYHFLCLGTAPWDHSRIGLETAGSHLVFWGGEQFVSCCLAGSPWKASVCVCLHDHACACVYLGVTPSHPHTLTVLIKLSSPEM